MRDAQDSTKVEKPKRLWIVPVEYSMHWDMAVLASSEEEARAVAELYADDDREMLSDVDTTWASTPQEATDASAIDAELLDTIPWGGNDDMTVAEWLEAIEDMPPSEVDMEAAGQLNMLAAS